MDPMKIGEVARRTGVTERTLRYYEEQGLLHPPREAGGHRTYDAATLAALYRILLLRRLGTPVSEVDPAPGDLLDTVRHHVTDLDEQMTSLARQREHARRVEDTLVRHGDPTDEELLSLLAGVSGDRPAPTRRLTLLVYRDLAAVAEYLVATFGFSGPSLTRDEGGTVVHAELSAGDGLIWLHREAAEFGLASPAAHGVATACMAVDVDDVDHHHEHVAAAGGDIVYPPTDMPYGVREYGVRDPEGGLWSFMEHPRSTT